MKLKVVGASQDTLSKLRNSLREKLNKPETLSKPEYRDPLFIKFVKLVTQTAHNLAFLSLPQSEFFERLYKMYSIIKNRRKDKITVEVYSQFGASQIYTLTKDMPFLLHSLINYTKEKGLLTRFIVHPILNINYDKDGNLAEIDLPKEKRQLISIIYIEIAGNLNKEAITGEVKHLLEQLQVTVSDFVNMKNTLKTIIEKFRSYPNARHDEISFLEWLLDDNFIFLGYRFYKIDIREGYIQASGDSFGITRLSDSKYSNKRFFKDISGEIIERITNDSPLIIDKTNSYSIIERKELMNFIGIAKYDSDQKLAGRFVFLGIFSNKAQTEQPSSIPILKDKLNKIVAERNLVVGSHDYRETVGVFNSIPKDELFLTDVSSLKELIDLIIVEDPLRQVRIFVRPNLSARGLSIIVIFDQHFYSEDVLKRITNYLKEHLAADTVDYNIYFRVHGLVRIHYYFNFYKSVVHIIDLPHTEEALAKILESWQHRLVSLIKTRFKEGTEKIIDRYSNAFDTEYQNCTEPEEAITDIKVLHEFVSSPTVIFDARRKIVKIYSTTKVRLAEIVPILSNMNLVVIDEALHTVRPAEGTIYIERLDLKIPENITLTSEEAIALTIESTLKAVVDNDTLNSIALYGLNYKQIDLIRAVRNYLIQLSGYSSSTIDGILTTHPKFALLLIDYFNNRFDPGLSKRDDDKLKDKLSEYLAGLKELKEDLILRSIMTVFFAMIRTNYFKSDTEGHYISFKIASGDISFMKPPVPLYEIFVHSYSTDGIHLRSDLVSRGGIRYSDRPDDFRTEILDLMNTQVAKNSIIVPSGSKGGFVIRHQIIEDTAEQIKSSYSTLMRGLLDLTDNIVEGKVVHPSSCVIYDDDDPYLVVAADKGTAWLSDRANEISAEYNFWLHDAFASGGKYGYDHKKEGITARGAFESVKWHFKEIGIDFNKPFTVAGIGDMSGDVFGNGMLCSDKIKLIAAFNHLHIFIDPNPDPAISFNERKRLFGLGRSSWDSYNPSLISAGGGVFSRKSKSIKLSDQAKKALDTDKDNLSGEQLIQLILSAPVDLLYNGGIGTYIKDIGEPDSEVADHANDACRITVDKVRAKVIGEGGNLGITMAAREKLAARGIRVNTDAVDNSGGVNLSDHEVNLKILFKPLMEKGRMSLEERNRLLEENKEEVISDVLTDNKLVNLMLSLEQERIKDEKYLHFLDLLTPEIVGRKLKSPVTRPELSVVSAYERIYLKKLVAGNDICKSYLRDKYLRDYFPKKITDNFADAVSGHLLKDSIASTGISSRIVNFSGIATVDYLSRITSRSRIEIIKLILMLDELFDLKNSYYRLIDEKNPVELIKFYESRVEILLKETVLNNIDPLLTNNQNETLKKRLVSFLRSLNIYKEGEPFINYLNNNYISGFPTALNISETLSIPMKTSSESLLRIYDAFNFDNIRVALENIKLSDDWDYQLAWQIRKKLNRCVIMIAEIAKKKFDSDIKRCLECDLGHLIRKETELLPKLMKNLHPILVVVNNITEVIENFEES